MKGAARTTERDVNERTALSRERSELAKDRTRLANKRTFLAWCRTALAFMTFGFLLEKIDSFILSQHISVPDAVLSRLGALGMLAFMGGPVVMFFAGWRYYLLEKSLVSTRASFLFYLKC